MGSCDQMACVHSEQVDDCGSLSRTLTNTHVAHLSSEWMAKELCGGPRDPSQRSVGHWAGQGTERHRVVREGDAAYPDSRERGADVVIGCGQARRDTPSPKPPWLP